MSIVQVSTTNGKVEAQLMGLNYDEKKKKILDSVSPYNPSSEEKNVRALILKHFTLGNVNMWKPRVEFNDLSVIMRDQIDQMAWNTYQPNNGQPLEGDEMNAWKSQAIRPVVRNKAISIVAHATARLIFPKVFAFNQQSDQQEDSAMVMTDLMEWAGEQSNYEYYSLNRVIVALYSPASIGYTEYAEVYRNVKTEKDSNGIWIETPMLDEDMSGFRDEVIPVDQLFIENFYEPDMQKQSWLIMRKVINFETARLKYQSYPNFQFVSPGIQILYNDANQTWYQVYDTNMRQEDAEEIIYWNKSLDVKIVLVNGIMLSDSDCPNPRNDKKYPFDKFGYQLINSRCFYYKSLANHLQQDASIVNTLYPMIIDGTYLSIMKPMVNVGGEIIGSDVLVPGAVTTLKDPKADLRPINTSIDLKSGMDTLAKVEESINESSQSELSTGQSPDGGTPTAYQISKEQQNASTILGLFVKMISEHVKQYGKLRMNDILQYLTIPEVSAIEDDPALVFKTFLMPDKHSAGRNKTRKIQFDMTLPTESITEAQYLDMSYGLLKQQGGMKSKQELWKVSPELFRNNKYMAIVSPDVLNPMSEELERAFDLELYDRAIQNPILDQEQVTKDFLLGAYNKSRRNPDKYLAKPQSAVPGMNIPMQNPQQNQPQGQNLATPSQNALQGAKPMAVQR